MKRDSFSGEAYDEDRDCSALTGQLRIVFDIMSDQKWRSVRRIQQLMVRDYGQSELACPENSIQAQIRNLRKPKFGNYECPRKTMPGKRGGRGYSVYRLGNVLNDYKVRERFSDLSPDQLLKKAISQAKVIRRLKKQIVELEK